MRMNMLTEAMFVDYAGVICKSIYKWLVNDFMKDCMKRARIRSYSGPYFPVFGLNTERYSVSLYIQSECWKIPTRITPNTDTFKR